ncbi:MAG: glyoxalase [Rhodospirillaceae bacterium]|nr:glyoxalase [Rhodospirillaceae bacterium]MBT5751422.1 glyoxalase [Rhodospirillaceae bacterium]
MIRNFDHVTVVVRDIDKAKAFFMLLGLEEVISKVIEGEKFDAFMGLKDIKAEHMTLVLPGASPRMEVQLLKYHRPEIKPDPDIVRLDRLGFNHVCFAVDDIEAEVARLRAAGVEILNEILDFHSRKLVFIRGPEGITLELAELNDPN